MINARLRAFIIIVGFMVAGFGFSSVVGWTGLGIAVAAIASPPGD